MTRAITVTWCRGDAFVAHSGRVVAVRWTGVPSGDQLAALSEAHRAARLEGDVLLVNDVARVTGSTHVDAAAHAHIRALVTEGRDRTQAVAHVVEIPGAIGSVVRAFLAALEQLAGEGAVRTRSFANPAEAAAWLSQLPGAPADLASTWRAMERAAAPALAA